MEKNDTLEQRVNSQENSIGELKSSVFDLQLSVSRIEEAHLKIQELMMETTSKIRKSIDEELSVGIGILMVDYKLRMKTPINVESSNFIGDTAYMKNSIEAKEQTHEVNNYQTPIVHQTPVIHASYEFNFEKEASFLKVGTSGDALPPPPFLKQEEYLIFTNTEDESDILDQMYRLEGKMSDSLVFGEEDDQHTTIIHDLFNSDKEASVITQIDEKLTVSVSKEVDSDLLHDLMSKGYHTCLINLKNKEDNWDPMLKNVCCTFGTLVTNMKLRNHNQPFNVSKTDFQINTNELRHKLLNSGSYLMKLRSYYEIFLAARHLFDEIPEPDVVQELELLYMCDLWYLKPPPKPPDSAIDSNLWSNFHLTMTTYIKPHYLHFYDVLYDEGGGKPPKPPDKAKFNGVWCAYWVHKPLQPSYYTNFCASWYDIYEQKCSKLCDLVTYLATQTIFNGGWSLEMSTGTISFHCPRLLLIDNSANHHAQDITVWGILTNGDATYIVTELYRFQMMIGLHDIVLVFQIVVSTFELVKHRENPFFILMVKNAYIGGSMIVMDQQVKLSKRKMLLKFSSIGPK